MRATKHAAPQPWRRRGVTGIHGERLTVDGTAVQPDVASGRRPVRPALTSPPAGLHRPGTEHDRRSDPGLGTVTLRPHC